ncbi:hypothetical protein [Streptomyces sp. NPDC047968]|uniref:hypothetical protein n=1 Tax=unclassified Streptomyces TaxID=2593676 RepID=UPI00342F3A5F
MAGGEPAPTRPRRVAPAERGSTTVADRVVAKIATRAAREALPVPEGGAAPHAMVVVHHGAARIRISLELDYPCDIGGRCARVRRHVARRVRELADMEVPEVAVQVERLHSVSQHATAEGRLR